MSKILLMSDVHFMEDTPICRKDSYLDTLKRKLKWIADFALENDAFVVDGGDLFSHWRATPWLLGLAHEWLPMDIWSIPGNHDLPNRNTLFLEKSGFGFLAGIERVTQLGNTPSLLGGVIAYGVPYGGSLNDVVLDDQWNSSESATICVMHDLVDTKEKAYAILKKTKFNLILCGHYHFGFTLHYEDKWFVCPGSVMRMTADQVDYQPRVYLWDSFTNELQEFPIPIEDGVVTREHLEAKERKESDFIQRLDGEFEVELSFERNMEEYLAKNRVQKEVKGLIHKAMEKKE